MTEMEGGGKEEEGEEEEEEEKTRSNVKRTLPPSSM